MGDIGESIFLFLQHIIVNLLLMISVAEGDVKSLTALTARVLRQIGASVNSGGRAVACGSKSPIWVCRIPRFLGKEQRCQMGNRHTACFFK